MDLNECQPSTSSSNKDWNKNAGMKINNETSNTDSAEHSLNPFVEIKTEEIFIKEENTNDEDNLNDMQTEEDEFDYSTYIEPVQEKRIETQEPKDFNNLVKFSTLAADENSKEISSKKSTPKTLNRVKTSANSSRGKFIHKDFSNYKNYYSSTRKPSTKFTQYSDDCHIFGQYIASSLRNLKERKIRLVCQQKICKLLHEAQLSQLK